MLQSVKGFIDYYEGIRRRTLHFIDAIPADRIDWLPVEGEFTFGDLDYDVVEMVLADQEGWDRYEAAKWLTMRRWLEANPNDDFAKDVRAKLTLEPIRYAAYTREYLGWGVFALMAR